MIEGGLQVLLSTKCDAWRKVKVKCTHNNHNKQSEVEADKSAAASFLCQKGGGI